jgi:hypothetical protein
VADFAGLPSPAFAARFACAQAADAAESHTAQAPKIAALRLPMGENIGKNLLKYRASNGLFAS